MKNTLIIISTAFLLASCGNDAIPVPTGLLVEETVLTFVAEGETYMNRVYTTSSNLAVTVPQADGDWLAAQMEDGYLVITCQRNESIAGRSSTITLDAGDISGTVRITQNGLPTQKIGVVSATANSQQNTSGNESILVTYDNDYGDDHWHSAYSDLRPLYILTYTLAAAPSIDLIYVLPRQYSAAPTAIVNGRFTNFGLWVEGDGTDTPTVDPDDTDNSGALDPDDQYSGWGGLIGTVDADGFKLVYKGNAQRSGDGINAVILPVANPTRVKLVIEGGVYNAETNPRGTAGGFGSLSEIAFYGKVG